MLTLKKNKFKIYNKFILCNTKKVKKNIFWFFRILKCVTKRECVNIREVTVIAKKIELGVKVNGFTIE